MLILLIAAVVVSALPAQPRDPVIGVLVNPPTYDGVCVTVDAKNDPTMPPSGNFTGCVWSIYVKWLQSSGIRVMPVPWGSTPAQLEYLLDRVNGVLLPGGILEGDPTIFKQYFDVVQSIFDYTVARNEAGDKFVLWGTCQGFELINAAAARNISVILPGFVGVDPQMLSVNFTADGMASRMFAQCPDSVMKDMTDFATTLNWHTKGVIPEEFKEYPLLSSSLSILATSNDATGRTFIAATEHQRAAIFAVQFHPERPPYEFDNDKIDHGTRSVSVSNYLSMFLVNQLRKNNHTFESDAAVEALLIDNYPVHNQGFGVQVYYV